MTRPGAGTFVINHDEPGRHGAGLSAHPFDDVLQLFEARAALGIEAAGLAASRRTPLQLQALRHSLDKRRVNGQRMSCSGLDEGDFHVQIAGCTGNCYLIDAIAHLCAALRSASYAGYAVAGPGRLSALGKFDREQEEIYTAIGRRDAHSARAAMLVHLANCRERLKARYCRFE